MALVYALQRVLMRNRLRALLATIGICVVAGVAAGALVAVLTPLWAVALLAGVAGALLMLRSRQFTLLVICGIICLLPFASLPLNVGFSPTFLNLALGVLYLVWALRVATGRQERWASSPISPAVAVFLLLTFGAFVAGLGHASLTATSLRKFAEIPLGIALYFAVINHVRTHKALQNTTFWLIVAGFTAAAVGIFLYVIPQLWAIRLLSALRIFRYPAGPDVLRFVEDDPDLPMRAIGTSVDPNVLGALLVLTMGLAAPHIFSPQPRWRRVVLAVGMGLSGICLILTYSRSSLVGLGAALAVLGALRYRRALLVVALAGMLLLVLPQTRSYVTRFAEGIRGEDRATQMRFGEYKDAFILIQRYPWLGVGFVDAPDIDLYLGVSSLYLLIAEEMGLIGLAAFLICVAVFLLVLFDAWRRQGRAKVLEPWLLGPGVAIVGGLVGGLLDHTLFSFSHALTLFWLIVGLGAVAARLSSDSAEPDLARGIAEPE